MPYVINGQAVSEELIRQEQDRLSRDPQWSTIEDEADRARRLRAAAEASAADSIVIDQAAAADKRPVTAADIDPLFEQMKAQAGGRGVFDELAVRTFVEREFRVQRFRRDMIASARNVTPEEVEAFYNTHRENFRKPQMFHAAHIVKHVTREQTEDQARAGIELAFAELERGEPFAEVAERHSDCKGSGGDLGEFPAGEMVEEFDEVLRALQPSGRSGIFSTPFGFHIAELRGVSAPASQSLEEVRQGVERVLNFAAQHEAYLREIADLRSKAVVRWVSDQQAATG